MILISIEYIIAFDLLFIYIYIYLFINNWELHWKLSNKKCVLINLIIFGILSLKIYQTHTLNN